ncbi:MAG: ABC transporter substrate-binding protein [Mycobacterium sp.]|nr:ABC transporter substrate-binding protein [Mycobacterium sp.]
MQLMNRHRTVSAAIGIAAVAAIVISGCGSNSGNGGSSGGGGKTTTAAYNAAFDNIVNASTKTGGTLNLLTSSDCDSWDPQRTYYGWCWNMQRLFTRSLIGYSKLDGTKFTLAPDLATDMGTHNADYTQWTYTLKSGLKWSNGQPITPMDIKYGVERLWATDVINGGPSSYFIQGIKAPSNYAGPYKDGDNNVGITTTATTITFNLTGPNADFDYLMAMAASAPVPYKTEGGPGFTGANYTKHPLSSGPFMIKSYTPNKSVVFVRNPNWSQSTDTIRHPLVNQVDLTVDTDPVDIDKKLAAGTADANASSGVQAEFQAQILTKATLKANADDPVAASTRYAAIIPSVIPNVHCRLAIFYAWDKAGFIRAYGGTVAGDPAGGMAPPGIPGYKAGFDPFPSGAANTGDDAKAKQELAACGKPNGFSTKIAYGTPSPHAAAAFAVEEAALAKVGIQVTADTHDSSSYYSTWIGSPQNLTNQGIGIAFAGWGADFPTGVGFFQSITNGNAILPTGNSNYASLNDPTVNKVLDEAPAGKATEADWESLNNAIAQSGTYLPILYEKTLYYRNPRMTNVTCDNALAFGIYDFVNVGVSS